MNRWLTGSVLAGALLLADGRAPPASASIQAGIACSPSCAIAPGATVRLTSTTTSSSPISKYEWDLDGDRLYGAADEPDEPNGTATTTADRAFPAAGTFEVGLRVTNLDRDLSAARQPVTVSETPPPPGVPPPTATPYFLHLGWGVAPTAAFFPNVIGQPPAAVPDDEPYFEEREPRLPLRRRPKAYRRDREGAFSNQRVKGKKRLSIKSPAPSLTFLPQTGLPDALLAVGNQHLIAGSTGAFAFFAKTQQDGATASPLPPLPGGGPTSMTFNSFFAGFVSPTNPDGSENLNNINRYLGLGSNPALGCDPSQSPAPKPGTGQMPGDACVNEFYDARVFFDAAHKRFVAIAHARNSIWLRSPADHDDLAAVGYTDDEIDTLLTYNGLERRYLVFAVSAGEDPRGGWHQYITTNSNYADWPLGAVGKNVLVLGHKRPPESGKPVVTAVSLSAIEQGQADPPYTAYPASSFGAGGFPAPVVGYGNTHGLAWFMNDTASGGKLKLSAILDLAPPGQATPPASPLEATLKIAPALTGDLRVPPVYRDGRIAVATSVLREKGTGGVPDRLNIRPTAIAVTGSPAKVAASTSKAGGFRDLGLGFGRSGPGDAPGDIVSYQLPTLTMNEDHDMLIVYARVGVKTKAPLHAEARYSVWYHNEKLPRRSALLKAAGGSKELDQIDFISAVVDPADGTTFWMIGVYAKSNTTRGVVIGKVKP